MATEEAIAAGLIDWINSLAVSDPVYTVDDFINGDRIWKTLQQIDRFSFPGKLPENPDTDQWINKWTNLKHIYDALSIFLVEECSQRLPLPGGRPDLKAIAQSSSLTDTIALLKLLVVAAINCADRIEYLKQMQDLAESTQEVLMQTVQEAGDDAAAAEDAEPEDQDGDGHDVDFPTSPQRSTEFESVLESEERLGKVIADNQRIAHEKRELQKQLKEAHSRYEKLQERFDQGQDDLKESNDRLSAILAGKSDIAAGSLDSKHDNLIATLENRVLEAEAEVEELRRNNEVLKIKAEKAQKLQDDYDEMKIERDRLARKANTAEKYRQKLEASQDLEKDNANLRSKVTELQSQLKQSDFARAGSGDLQREIDEYRRLLPSIEQERYELNEMKKRLEFDYHTLEARYHDTADQLSRQHQTVEELQSRLRDYEDGITPAPREERPPEPVDRDFEKEEAEFAESEARLSAALLNGDTAIAAPKDTDLTLPTDTDSPFAGLMDTETISEDELKAIMSAMRAQAHAGTATERESSLRAQKKMIVAIERQRSKNNLLLDHVQKQDQMIKDMRKKIPDEEDAQQQRKEDVPPLPPPKDKTAVSEQSLDEESEIERLTNQNIVFQRELKLMASACLFVTDADPNKRTTVPSLSFLVQHASPDGKATKLVFDLGLKRDLSKYPPAQQAHIANRQPTILHPDCADSLRTGGLDPVKDIDIVMLSHVHWDHEGTPDDFPNSEFVVGSGTLHLLTNGAPPHYPKEIFNPDLLPRDRTSELPPTSADSSTAAKAPTAHAWKPFAGFPHAIDFFGDGSVYVVDSPGHLFGHVNLLARLSHTKWVYLGGDCCHDPRILTGEKDIALYDNGHGGLRSVHVDTDQARDTLSKIGPLLKKPCPVIQSDAGEPVEVEVVVAHDKGWRIKNFKGFFPGTF